MNRLHTQHFKKVTVTAIGLTKIRDAGPMYSGSCNYQMHCVCLYLCLSFYLFRFPSNKKQSKYGFYECSIHISKDVLYYIQR